jgi:hypothetical protein
VNTPAWTTGIASHTIPSSWSGSPVASAREKDRWLARLAAKFGPEISLRDLTDRFSYDCLWRAEARSKHGRSSCGVYLPELEQPRPPDDPPGRAKLRLVKNRMCNLYRLTNGQAAIRDWFRARHDRTGNLPLLPGIFPDQIAPIVRAGEDGERELVMARWGMPGPAQYEPAPVTNIRNLDSPHWRAGWGRSRESRGDHLTEIDRLWFRVPELVRIVDSPETPSDEIPPGAAPNYRDHL